MRPLPLLAAGAAVAAAIVALVAVLVTLPLASTAADLAATDPGRTCGRVADPDFPIRTELRGGPAAYRAGGAAGEWSLDLTNTTGAECRHLHPVVVLYDRDRALDVAHVKLEMADDQGRMRALPLERTDQDEIVAVPDDGSPGFTVPPHRTVTVRARLAFTATARPNEISATAATVQRRGDGGNWVGASNTYRFAVAAPGGRARGTAPAAPVSASAPPSASAAVAHRTADSPTPSGTSAVGTSAAGASAGTTTGASSGDAAPVPRPGTTETGTTETGTTGTGTTGAGTTGAGTTGAGTTGAGTTGAGQMTGMTGARGDLVGRIVAVLALLTAGTVLALGVRRLRDQRP
ncbi:hypothetical protein [Streptomyces sp. NPDC059092]|uniref:hypothetical protein n=1 Tax=Streptomyces sp. NPDC059092 TaxID=3346725 RepID=UPI0036819DCA